MFRFKSINTPFQSLRSIPTISTSLRTVNQQLISKRFYSDVKLSDYEQMIYDKLSKELTPKELEVMDISGGCGSMFAINVVSDNFKGLTMIKQHKLVNKILADEIAKWHGLQLHTKAPK